ncbi:hypothetical protein RvY_00830 [Ramazzottius varieornatus]|uniref:HMG box domain-containing protein n=1 Tax=Ramazzottius varieornatus TaxID=947166 RepID=A0A1D1UI56_RAMVA|nr:hypothetical protein RvY_00830 [Ramazzottius varieornatus]
MLPFVAGSTNHTQSWPGVKSMSSYVRQEIWNRARMLLSIQPLGYYTPLTAEQQASLANLKVRAKRNRKNKGQVGRPANTGNAPRRPLAAYTHFKNHYQQKHSTLKTAELKTEALAAWAALPADAKQRYTDAAAADLERFTTETRAYTAALAAQTSPTKAKSPAKKPA